MFDKETFANILKKIYKTYNNQRAFAEATGVNRAYLSQYMNKKLENPPSPKILEKIAKNSNNTTTYENLMRVCGYLEEHSNSPTKKLIYIQKNEELERKRDQELENLKLSSEEFTVYNSIFFSLEWGKDVADQVDNILESYDEISKISKSKIKKAFLINQYYNEKSLNLFDEVYHPDNQDNKTLSNKPSEVSSNLYMCPVYGQISAGQPNWAEECLEGYLPIDPNLMGIINPDECFFLRVKGESMNQLIKNGAYALIRKQDIVENGEVAVVLVNGYEATLKRFTKRGDVIVLEPMSDNPNFKMQIYDKNTRIQILGKYIGKFEMT